MSGDDFDLGAPGNCLSCSKQRDRVIGESCIDCRVHYGTASAYQRAAHEYAMEEYRRGFDNGRSVGLSGENQKP